MDDVLWRALFGLAAVVSVSVVLLVGCVVGACRLARGVVRRAFGTPAPDHEDELDREI